MTAPLRDWDDFIIRWEEFKVRHTRQQKAGFTALAQKWRAFQRKVEAYRATNAPDFNVFSILGLGHLEVTTHTPFLRALLDPRGQHGQGMLFLSSFLRRLGLPASEVDHPFWRVVPWQQENVDIWIENNVLCKAVFIENKIYSTAHSGQLTRYYRIWKERFGDGGAFVYLSIRGTEPDAAGFEEDPLHPMVSILNELILRSYKDDIRAWLEECSEKSMAPVVKMVIQQYLALIASL